MVGWSETEQDNMRAALAEAEAAAGEGDVPVGALVDASRQIIARGNNLS